MAEHQSTDGSFFSRDTDEDKSLESIEDGFSTIVESGKIADKIDGKDKLEADAGTGNSDKEDPLGDKRAYTLDNSGKSIDNVDKNEKGATSDINNEVAKEKKKKNETKPFRNESTLIAIERYLKSGKCFGDTLEYEDVSAFNSKIHRYAVERTRGRQGMYFRDETIQKGDDANVKINPIILTEADVAQERLYHQIYQKEEYYAVATKFLKTVTDGAQDTGDSDFVLDTKTANWLKRAAGMRRQYDPYEKDDSQQYIMQRRTALSEDSDEGDGEAFLDGATRNDRRVTRRRVQMTRKKRRLERIEKETESFRVLSEVAQNFSRQTRIGRTKKGISQSWFTTLNDITDDDKDVKMIDAVPKDIDQSASDQAFPSLETTGLTTIHDRFSRSDDCGTGLLVGEREKPHKMEDRILPPMVARLGLEFRKRPVGLGEAARTSSLATEENDSDGVLNERVTDRAPFRKSKSLINALSNKRTRYWAMYEFFYSDLDKQWYREDGFASELAKHGFPIDHRTRLTRQEWSLVRRKLRPRRRIFSKRFIADQLKRRNRHRALVRSLQQDPNVKDFAPIAPGTVVNAFDNNRHSVRTGRILLHDPKNHSYLVQFDDKDSGCDICLDSEVAISLPRTNGRAPSQPPLYTKRKEFGDTKIENDTIEELVIRNDSDRDGCMKGIERELLISTITIATEAFERKKAILETLEIYADSSTKGTSDKCSQLLANLNRINTTLELALSYFQVLYGRVYGQPASKSETTETDIKKTKLDSKIPKSKDYKHLVASLVSISSKVGGAIASSSSDDEIKNMSYSSKLLCEDLSNSTSLLLLANYLAESSSLLASAGIEKTTYSGAMNSALKTLFDQYSKSCVPQTPDNLLVGKKLEQESRIEEELKDLWFAVGMLRTEATLATDDSRTFELSNAVV
eukprot:CAMPEP_0116153242 /NCGR_PEP_ID=MMETSP0329-20121206/21123_1 /TAXON_ID=697910 /ORGANISM="Pseudo-nitzschia arenysensis, Strain B593" /LENGTH=912 /DNA_ID=CAMNT_0003650103 /DNA_START=248 /DNA_END=2986 /DNA_ORIENTATION=-